jgi:hypothetical protein
MIGAGPTGGGAGARTTRRGLLIGGAAGAALGMMVPSPTVSATSFGAVGDGIADDTAALQAALDTCFSGGGSWLVIPPGNYRVTRPLRIALAHGGGDIARHCGISAHGVKLLSGIATGEDVLELSCAATARFVLIEGLQIQGCGAEGAGLALRCEHGDAYFYNFCLRDIVIEGCGGNGCLLIGNVFEGQIFNSYFRRNGGSGAVFSHGEHAGILSAIHVFGCVFGDNGHDGVAMAGGCYDVAFHGCYFLLNGQFGLEAENGCTLLSNCGFENNHAAAPGPAPGNMGIGLTGFATLIGCTAYSVFKQTGLIRGFVVGRLIMIGCTGSGGGNVAAAGLAQIDGLRDALATLIGCAGSVEYANGFEGIEVGGDGGGIRFGSDWRSTILPRLGDYRLWVDSGGRLRMKHGPPQSDMDGAAVDAVSGPPS